MSEGRSKRWVTRWKKALDPKRSRRWLEKINKNTPRQKKTGAR